MRTKELLSHSRWSPSAAMLALIFGLLFGQTATAQPNVINTLDVSLSGMGNLTQLGHEGTFPTGRSGLAMETTCCNEGGVNVDWFAPMDERHPFIAFMMTREVDGRMEQISDRSYVKHGFASINASGCGPCGGGSSQFLIVDCSDTYAVGNNGDRFWLGPAQEINPWLGTWSAKCSHFDMGEPPVAPPNECDGNRSLTNSQINALGSVAHRVEVNDADLNDPSATYYYCAQYVVEGEIEVNRANNLGCREVVPTWNGSSWTFNTISSLVNGSVLDHWTGASVSSVTNGLDDDGRLYVGVSVTGPDGGGFYRYEYAVHNRDNARGVNEFIIPVCPSATVQNVDFHDIDDDAGNDWTFSQDGATLTFSTTDNALEWNSIFNFGFDCDAAPVGNNEVILHQSLAGSGADNLVVNTETPTGPSNLVDLGFGTVGGNGLIPNLTMCGALGVGEMGDIVLSRAASSTPAILVLSDQANPVPYKGGMLAPLPFLFLLPLGTDANGEIILTAGGLVGPFDLVMQYVVFDVGGTNNAALSNAISIPIP